MQEDDDWAEINSCCLPKTILAFWF